MIPKEWHKEYAFNCLSDEEFALFSETHNEGDEMYVDDHYCECETFTLDGYHRCNCGNRRCYIVKDEYNGHVFFWVGVG